MMPENVSRSRERLDRFTARCPRCQQAWLVPGLAVDERYACKKCGAGMSRVKDEAVKQQLRRVNVSAPAA